MKLLSYNQPNNTPVPKVQAVGTVGGGIVAIVTLLAIMGVIVPDNVSVAAQDGITALFIVISAGQAILTFAAGYFKRDVKSSSVADIIKEKTKE